MPKISEFYGILIYMYYDDHGIPHIHARCGGEDASFAIETGEMIKKGEIPYKKRRMVQKWIKMHKSELMSNWEKVSSDEQPRRIEGLQ